MRFLILAVVSFALLTACGKSSTEAVSSSAPTQTATVKLKDGGSFTGAVKNADSTAITLQSESGETRTYPMAQVASVNYSPNAPAPDAAKPSPVKAIAPSLTPTAPADAVKTPAATTAAAKPVELLTVPAGATLEIRNNEAIDSQKASASQTYSAVVAKDIMDDQGRVAVPKGANATLVVREAVGQGKLKGQSELVLDVDSVEVAGHTYKVETEDLEQKGKDGIGANKRTAVHTGGGAAVGALIGAIAGGAKGAAIGAASGAAAGGGLQAATRGKAVRVPSETVLSFKLEAPLKIRLVK